MAGMRLGLRAAAAALAALSLAGAAAAGEPPCPEHGKLNTADASPVDPGRFEVETGYSYCRARRYWDGDGDSRRRELTREHCVGLALTAGVREDLDLSVSSCHHWLRDDANDYDDGDGEPGPRRGEHFGDLDFGGRYRFLKDQARSLEMAVIAGFTAPTGSRNCRREIGTSQEFWSFNPSLVASRDWGRWTANAEAGYSVPFGEHRDEARGVLSLNLAAGCQLRPWLQPELELNYAREYLEAAGDPELLAGTAGLVLPASDWLRVNVGVQEALWGRNADRATALFLAVKLAF